MVPLDGESNKKRVVCSSLIICLAVTSLIRLTNSFPLLSSATSLTLILVVFTMALGIREVYVLWVLHPGLADYELKLKTRMKPTRIRMCHSLVMNYGLYKKMEIFVRIIIQLAITQQYEPGPFACTACQTRHQTRNDPVSLRWIRWFSKSDHTNQHELLYQRAT
jgi:histone deacetylase 1/2